MLFADFMILLFKYPAIVGDRGGANIKAHEAWASPTLRQFRGKRKQFWNNFLQDDGIERMGG